MEIKGLKTSIENEIARIKGENLSTEEKNKRKQETILLKKELESKKVEKINLDRLLHKMESEVKKLNREITQIDKEKITTQVKLEEIELIINKCKVKNKSLQDQVESLLLEEQLMKVAETKSRSEVETASNELAEMGKENIQIENDIRERREELQARKDIKTKEREDRSIKLNTRYECLLKSLGDVRKLDGDEVPSHAYHILKLAQKKAELRDEAAEMGCKISKKEKDLKELEATLNSLRDSNSNYRGNVTTTLKGSPSQEEEISLLEGQISKKKDEIASLHSEICELEKDIRLKKERISEFELRLERSKRIYDNKIHVLRTAEKELLSQNEKYERAFKLKSKIGKKFYEKIFQL
ncbi:unnamed protein product [Lepeophtheirus salmonis]|uniref:Coiled-coil domain-containing protein 39 n=1 Tax=Lepeophtheirus salmonis TaxID=72036 RepID=A0A7R8D312_LEPSM|nr:unnamed protein product [Lepeophtheirus salmonis]CAF3011930.1 unnamed protein product [Lepeophtheirus salmonis]